MPEPDSEDKTKSTNEERAKAQWQAHRETLIATTGHAIQFGVAALIGVMTINGAALGAVVGLVSANSKHLQNSVSELSALFSHFALGFILSALATCGAYAAQFFYALQAREVIYDELHPWVHPTSRWKGNVATVLHIATVSAALGSLALLTCGLYSTMTLLPKLVSFAAVGDARAAQSNTTWQPEIMSTNPTGRLVCFVDPASNRISVPCRNFPLSR